MIKELKKKAKKIIPSKILQIRIDYIEQKNKEKALYWKERIEKEPQKHAEFEMKRTKQDLIRPVDINDPIFFNEKMLWLKYFLYNKSPLVAKCYNKFEVRKYIQSKGLGDILNDLYGAWDNVRDIEWDKLPEEYVMKVSNGWAGHIFKRKNKTFDINNAKKQLVNSMERTDYMFYLSGDLFANKTEQKIVCERLLHSNYGYEFPEDYKFYCFHGKPLYLETMKNRKVDGDSSGGYEVMFLDIDLNDRCELEKGTQAGMFNKPKCYEKMVDIARKLSEDFPFVRVDLYVESDRPIFGELTFTPNHEQTRESLVELGRLIDLSDMGKYKSLLNKIEL
ncbi:MAG: hypothetical protein E7203_09455 [Selenomonas ruminantium]|uniref:TupA-like ATPgrasp n=1 Tax=Selenomonas ruminantium TaxID=971 RepID=A0A927WJL8_SELRU|nr:ATP-grasp fold amidoligase family protein [Selenomonas ruminantium]MBE6085655.1 hypothetical protein [Selenomonas ruminantium]